MKCGFVFALVGCAAGFTTPPSVASLSIAARSSAPSRFAVISMDDKEEAKKRAAAAVAAKIAAAKAKKAAAAPPKEETPAAKAEPVSSSRR